MQSICGGRISRGNREDMMAKTIMMRIDPSLADMLDKWKPDASRRKQTSALAKELEKMIYGKK